MTQNKCETCKHKDRLNKCGFEADACDWCPCVNCINGCTELTDNYEQEAEK